MMTTRRDVEEDMRTRVIEYRGDDRDIREVGAAIIWCVERKDIARPDAAVIGGNDGFDRTVHGAEVHRHMRCVRHERAIRIENRAGKIKPLLDVYRRRRVLERDAHLLGNGHEEIVEDFEQHRIGLASRSPFHVRTHVCGEELHD